MAYQYNLWRGVPGHLPHIPVQEEVAHSPVPTDCQELGHGLAVLLCDGLQGEHLKVQPPSWCLGARQERTASRPLRTSSFLKPTLKLTRANPSLAWRSRSTPLASTRRGWGRGRSITISSSLTHSQVPASSLTQVSASPLAGNWSDMVS